MLASPDPTGGVEDRPPLGLVLGREDLIQDHDQLARMRFARGDRGEARLVEHARSETFLELLPAPFVGGDRQQQPAPVTATVVHPERVQPALLGRIGIRGRGPLRPGDLAGMVHEVAGDQRLLAARGDPHTDVAGSMARGRDEADLVADPVIGLYEIDEAGLPDRGNRISEDRGHVLAV